MSTKKIQLINGASIIPKPDWNQTDDTKADYIKNKPTTLDGYGITDAAKATDIANLSEQIEVERSRINGIASLPEGSTTGDAELIDIRTAANGTTYETAGEAVRAQVNMLNEADDELKSDLDEVSNLFAPNINYFNKSKISANTWLNANGTTQEDSVYYVTDFIRVGVGETLYFTDRNRQVSCRSFVVFLLDKVSVVEHYESDNVRYAYTNNNDFDVYLRANFRTKSNPVEDMMAIITNEYDDTYTYPVLEYQEYQLVLKDTANKAQDTANKAQDTANKAQDTANKAQGLIQNLCVVSNNVFNWAACLVNHWLYDRDIDDLVEYNGYTVTDYILVPSGKTIVFSQKSGSTREKQTLRKPAIIYNLNKTKIGSYTETDQFYYYTNDSDSDVFVRFNIQIVKDNEIQAELVNTSDSPSWSDTYMEYGKAYVKEENILYEDIPENADVREFFKDEITDTVAKILALTDKPSYCMTFLTDTHLAIDSADSLRRTYDTFHNLKAVNDKVYSMGLSSTGDFVLGNQEQYDTQAIVDDICNRVRMGYMSANERVYMVNGNHDGIGGGVPKTNNYNSVMSHNEDYVIRENDNPYFYADHKKVKIRGIYLSTNTQIGDSHIWGMGTDEIQWLKSVLDTTPKDYSVIFYSHIGIFSEQFINGRAEVQSLVNSFHNHTGDYADNTGKCIAWFCGHEHFDWICPTSESGVDFPVIVTTASHLAGWNPPDGQYTGASAPSRTDGTVTQDAWDTIIYRPDEDKIYTVRFGAGDDRVIDLNAWNKTL